MNERKYIGLPNRIKTLIATFGCVLRSIASGWWGVSVATKYTGKHTHPNTCYTRCSSYAQLVSED